MTKEIIRVRDVMHAEFDIVTGQATVANALALMQKPTAKALIIEKRHEDDEYGIVMLSDIAKKVLAQDRAPERVNVYEIMSKPVFSVPPQMDIRYCARLFLRFKLHRAPVMENGVIIGIVSYNDMVLKGCQQGNN